MDEAVGTYQDKGSTVLGRVERGDLALGLSRNTTCLLISAADHIDQAHPPLTRCPAADDTVLPFGAILFAPNITPTTQGMWQPRSFALGTVTHKSVAFDHLRPLVTTSRTQVLDAVLRTESVTFKTTLHHGPQKRPSPAACLERIRGSGGKRFRHPPCCGSCKARKRRLREAEKGTVIKAPTSALL